jgi:hypothetical protein
MMKKYLLTGIAALALCTGFTACTDHDIDVASGDQAVVQSYNEAFIRVFGQPAPNHTWGFSSAEFPPSKVTRATGAFANHIGAYPDANDWTRDGFLAPDPLTHAQKLRAQYYFQMNQIINPNRPDYGTIDYFMQQVYDGGTDPMTGKSPERYLAADNSTLIESGEHMDHLTSGPSHLHIYNFNNGTCSTNGNVSDRDQTDVNDTSKQHADEIMLMLNTPTSCFGYANSDASCVRDDRWTLVSAATIDAFCDGDSNFQNWLASKLLEGEVDKKCDDEFHRDFIGFDFDQLPDESCYAGNKIDKNGNIVYYGEYDHIEYFYAQYGTLNEANDQYVYNLDGSITQYSSWDAYLMVDGFKIPYIKTDANQYCALGENANIGIGGQDGFRDYETIGSYNESGTNDNTLYLNNLPGMQNDKKAINMKFITKLVREGYLPIAGKDLKRWVKIGGCNDGYFSDWIVTFKPADSGYIPKTADLRVIVEDLSATQASDFDFNDVVFDVYYGNAGEAYLMVQAAGGTLPLTVAGVEVHQLFGYTSTNIMINTNARTGVSGLPAKKIPLTFAVNSPEEVRDLIEIKVTKKVLNEQTGEYESREIAITAAQGEPAAKIAVVPTFQWVNERTRMIDLYPGFREYVQNRDAIWDGNNF